MILGLTSTIVQFEASYQWLLVCTLALCLFVDTVNTVALCIYFRVERTGSSKYEIFLSSVVPCWVVVELFCFCPQYRQHFEQDVHLHSRCVLTRFMVHRRSLILLRVLETGIATTYAFILYFISYVWLIRLWG